MRLRVVGGPIRRTDRVVLDVTSNTTFEAIIALIYKKVEALDLADLAKDYFNSSSTSPTTTTTLATKPGSGDNDAFGDTVHEDDSTSSSASEVEDGADWEHRSQLAQKKKSYSLPRALSTRTVAGVTPSLTTAGSSAALLQQSPNRLSSPPIDFVHYHIALLEFGPDDKPFATRLCRKTDTPRSVHMRIPVIGLFLRKEFKSPGAGPDCVNLAVGGIESPTDDILAPPAAAPIVSPLEARPANESPLVRLTSPAPQAPGDGPPLSNAKDMSLSRPMSFALHYSATTFPPTSALQRALALLGVPRSDTVNTARVQRVLEKVGPHRHEVFLVTAERAMRGHGSYDRQPSSPGNIADAPMCLQFPLQNIKDVLTMCLTKLDTETPYEAAFESASIMADMLVHAAPVGEELLYSAVFLGLQFADYRASLRSTGKIIDISAAQWLNTSMLSSVVSPLGQLLLAEEAHRAILERHELRSLEGCERTQLMVRFYTLSRGHVAPRPRSRASSNTSSLFPIGPPVVDDDLVWERLAEHISKDLLASVSSKPSRFTSSPSSVNRVAANGLSVALPAAEEDTVNHAHPVPREISVTKPVLTPQRGVAARLSLEAPVASIPTRPSHTDPNSSSSWTSHERPPKAVAYVSASTPGGDSSTSFSVAIQSPTSRFPDTNTSERLGTLEHEVSDIKAALAQQTILLQRLLDKS